MSLGLLSLITWLPAVGALILLFVPGDDARSANTVRWIALVVSTINFVLSLYLWSQFDASNAGFQFVENFEWIGSSIGYRMGVDGVSILFVVLTAFLLPICVLASWEPITKRVREYMIVFLVLETLMIGVFATLDLAMFYVFFEGTLIPMFLIIGIWGGPRRIQATYKFFFYSFTGTVLMLIAIMAMYWQAGTLDITKLLGFPFDPAVQPWLWIAFFASFAVKMPMWPFHRWLPEAHVEAPTAGSVILAAVLLKLGGYGFIRFSLAMFPDASLQFAPFVFVLSVAAIIVTSLVALVQTDIKKLIAYSSVAHMGFVTMGIFAGNVLGVHGAVFQMLSHGIVSGALFLCVGVVYDRLHTREISAYGGLVSNMPQYAVVFMVFTMANVGLPGTSGFVGEFLTLIGAFQVNTWVAFFAAFGVILSAAYALWLYRRVIFGVLEKDTLKAMGDLNPREMVTLGTLAVLTILFGFYPAPLLDASAASVEAMVGLYQNAVGAAPAVLEATAH
jgi:NADH-quinone oxidoreductase subunit M